MVKKLPDICLFVCCRSMIKIIKTEEEDDTEENLAENTHLLPTETGTPCQEPIKSER
jgi:hypothetical protein